MGRKRCYTPHHDATGKVDGVCTLSDGHFPPDEHHAYDAHVDIRWTDTNTVCRACGRIGRRGFTRHSANNYRCTATKACQRRQSMPLWLVQKPNNTGGPQ